MPARSPTRSEGEPASFRDPGSSVFYVDGRVLRGLRAPAAASWDALSRTRFFGRLSSEDRIVSTRLAPPEVVGDSEDDWTVVLEHERVPFVSYPYEWTFSMLKDAAVLHLDALLAAMEEGFTTTDGSAFNIQWKGSHPLFIDVASFESDGGGPWAGYRQFCSMFLFPLMLQAYRGVSFQPLLRSQIDGLGAGQLRRFLAPFDHLRPGVFRHVDLQAALEGRLGHSSTESVKSELRSAGFGSEVARAVVSKLLTLVRRLEWEPKTSGWSTYRQTCTYSSADEMAKGDFVRQLLAPRRRRLVWDLGCNDGAYSRLAAEHGDHVVAVDSDHGVVERLYRALRGEGNRKILPLVINLLDPSPGLGWRGMERKAFVDRGNPEVVLSLALVHHLTLGGNVPLAEVVDWLASFDAEVAVEFVDRHDPMARQLLANKPAGTHDGYRLDTFEALLGERFDVRARQQLPSGSRVLFHAAPRK